MRTKIINILVLFLFAGVMVSAQGISSKSSRDKSERTKSFKVKKGGDLVVNVNPGDITISPWSNDEVYIKVKGIDEDELRDVEMELRGNTVSIKYNSGWGWSDDAAFQISLPAEFNILVNTTGGDIDINGNVTGTIGIQTSGGDIKARDVNGKFKANTSGGDIKLGDITGELSVNTSGGDISVGSVSGKDADLSTMGGDIIIGEVKSSLYAKTYGGDIVAGKIGGDADVTTFGGDLKLRNVSGSAKMSTYGGDIVLDGADGRVDAETKGGDIRLRNIKGIIDAKTAAGDIEAELYPSGKGDSYLSSSHGKIELWVPSSAKVTIVASIKLRGWWNSEREKFDIKSDFHSTDYKNDDKDISATYELNGGGQKINLRTVNSGIRIRKMN